MPDPQEAATVLVRSGEHAQGGEGGPQLGGRPERAVGGQQVGDRQVQRARDVPGHRVERLDLAAVAGGRPGVDQPARFGQFGGPVDLDDRHRARPNGDRPGTIGTLRAGGRSARGHGRPRGQAAVQHPNVAQTRPAQQPPGPGRRQSAAAVVHHDGRIVVDARRPPDRLQIGRIRQRVPAAEARRRREVTVEVDEHRARDVRGQIAVVVAAGEGPADVEQHRSTGLPFAQQVGEFSGVDQGGDRQGASISGVARHRTRGQGFVGHR